MTPTLEQFIADRGHVDWRFPDEFGLSERTLDCKQLAVKEVLRWQGETRFIPIYLNSFDCLYSGGIIKRNEPQLQNGHLIQTIAPGNGESLRHSIQRVYEREGYCLLFYQASQMPLSAYYGKYRVTHWSLVIGMHHDHVTVLDDAGIAPYFTGYMGRVSNDLFFASLQDPSIQLGLGWISKEKVGEASDWDSQFLTLMKQSAHNMIAGAQIEALKQFFDDLEQTETSVLVSRLEVLEFHINYYRKLRELWLHAVHASEVPTPYFQSEWIEELTYICKCWSLVMGVIMKWKRQPHKDYKDKLMDYLWDTYRNEQQFFHILLQLTG